MKPRMLLAGLIAVPPLLVVGSSRAMADSVSYNAAAQAPIFQITQDDPTAQFHPQGEGDWGYSMASASPGGAGALSSVVWPGSAAGNAGSLAVLLGAPSQATALNDPVRAQAGSGSSQTQDTVSTPSGTEMTASVVPTGPGDQHASASSSLAGGGLGDAGATGASKSSSVIDFNAGTGVLTAAAASSASGVDIDGIIHIGSVKSSATGDSTNGSTPKLSGETTFSDFTIAGQQAYVDSNGVHMGSPGHPAGSIEQQAVDSALHAAGMQVYYTYPSNIILGGASYYYASSVLFFWQPPGDSNHDTFTMSVGGAALSLSASPYSGGSSNFSVPPSAPTSTGGSVIGSPPAGSHTVLSLPSPASGSISPSLSSPPAALGSGANPSSGGGNGSGATPASVPAGVQLPGGLGTGWWLLLALAAVVGAALTTRLPSLLDRSAAKLCANERRLRNSSGRLE